MNDIIKSNGFITDEDYKQIGKDFVNKIPKDIWYNETPVEYVTGLENIICDLKEENKKLTSMINMGLHWKDLVKE